MVEHVRDRALNVLVHRDIEDVLAFAPRPNEPRTAQQAEVVADERARQSGQGRDLAHRPLALGYGEDDPEPARITQEPKHLGELAQGARIHLDE
jgi:hypothetical protein